jgi:hypothetical protein
MNIQHIELADENHRRRLRRRGALVAYGLSRLTALPHSLFAQGKTGIL